MELLQASLSGGELAPSLYGRVDMARYTTSLKTCRNFITRVFGGVVNRPGTQFCAEVKNSAAGKVRLIPFVFSTSQAYIIELGNLYMRAYYDGAPLLDNSHVLVDVVTPWTTAMLDQLVFSQCADVITVCHPNVATQDISRISTGGFTVTPTKFINGPFQDQNSDSTIAVSASGQTGTVTITASKPVFTAANIGQLFYLEVQDGGAAWVVGATIVVGQVVMSAGKYYRATTAGTTGTLQPVHSQDKASDGGVTWLYLNSGFGVVQIGAMSGTPVNGVYPAFTGVVQGNDLPSGVVVGSYSSVTVGAGGFAACPLNDQWVRVTTTAAHGAVTDSIVNYSAMAMIGGVPNQQLGSARVSVVSTTVLDLEITGSIAMAWRSAITLGASYSGYLLVPPTASTYHWAMGAFGGDQGWPAAVCYYQQRRLFAATPGQPQVVWMSRTGGFPDFGQSRPIEDDDAVTFSLNSGQLNSVRSMIGLRKLILLTSDAEWSVGPGAGTAITPSAYQIDPQGYFGASQVQPIGVGNIALYLQSMGQTIRDLGYDFYSDSYLGNDITVMAAHLVAGHQILEWAWQQVPSYCLWSIREDGVLLGTTYMKEQQIAAWHHHDTDGLFESVATIPEGSENAVYVVVNRTIQGVTRRYVERFASRNFTDLTGLTDAWFVDCGLSFDGTVQNIAGLEITNTADGDGTWGYTDSGVRVGSGITPFLPTDVGDCVVFTNPDGSSLRLTVSEFINSGEVYVTPNQTIDPSMRNVFIPNWAWARRTVSGLSQLEGKTVSILADGGVQPQQVVTGGTISINPPAVHVLAGLPYTSDIESLNLAFGSPENSMAKKKNIAKVYLLVENTRGIWAGRSFDKLLEFKQRSIENYGQPTNLLTGLARIDIVTNWDQGGTFVVRQTDPLPITINALIPEVAIGG